MPETPRQPSSRRRFIQNVVGGSAAIAAAGVGGDLLAQQAGGIPSYPPPQGGWDLGWVARVEKARHRVVFDSAEIDDGIAMTNAQVYLAGFREVYNAADSDMAVVLVIRHQAIQMALNDTIWERAQYGESLKVNDPATGEPAKRNIWVGRRSADGAPGRAGPLDGLLARGVIVLCCNLALMRVAGAFARAHGMPVDEARQLFIDSVVPGIVRQTSGIFAVVRAQAAGAQLVKSA